MMANGHNRLYCSVTWTIRNYLNAMFKVDEIFESPEFKTNFKVPMKWKFGICVKRREGRVHMTEFILRPISPTDKPQSTDVRIEVEIQHKESPNIGEMASGICNKNVWYEGKISFSCPEGICFGNKEMFSDVKNDYKPDSDYVTITVTCDFLCDDAFDTNIDEHLRQLSRDLNNFVDSQKLCDLKLISGDRIFPVHKSIVTARSSYVARILNENPNLREIDLTQKCSEDQLNGIIKYWYTGNIEELPKTLSTSTLNFLLNMQDVGLARYIPSENIEIYTTFEIREEYFKPDLTPIEDEPMKKVYKYGDVVIQFFIRPSRNSGNEDSVSLHIKLQRGLEHLLYLEVYPKDLKDPNDLYDVKKFRRITSIFVPDLACEKCQFESIMTLKEFKDLQQGLLMDKRPLVAYKTWRCRIKHHISSVWGADISTLEDKNPYRILANHMERLLESKAFSDFTLITENKSFDVHKAILAARSSWFFDLFSSNEDKKSKSHEMMDVDTEMLSIMLKHMYYAQKVKAQITLPLLGKLIFASIDYDLPSLESECRSIRIIKSGF